VTIPSGVTVQGAGKDASWIKGTVVYGSNVTVRDIKLGDANCSTRNGSGAAAVLFERVRFVGGGQSGVSWPNNSVLIIGSQYSCNHITFKDCVVERNAGSDPDFSQGFNNISLIERAGVHVSDVTFEGCTVAGAPRMGLECYTSTDASQGWANITLRNCVFAASDGASIDFSDASYARASGVLVEGCTIAGGGATKVDYGYGICLEMPQNVIIRNNTFTRAWLQSINVTDRGDSRYVTSGAQITGNTFDLTTGTAAYGGSEAPIILKKAGNVFSGNTIKGGWGTSGIVSLWYATANTVSNNTFTGTSGATAVAEHTGCSGNTLTPNTVQ
jgi:pectate lyase